MIPAHDVEIRQQYLAVGVVVFALVVMVGAISFMAGRITEPEVAQASNPASAPDESSPGTLVIEAPQADATPSPQVFYQAMAAHKEIAEKWVKYFNGKGLTARTEPSSSAGLLRVLVGPFDGQEEARKGKLTIQRAGFQPMLRKF